MVFSFRQIDEFFYFYPSLNSLDVRNRPPLDKFEICGIIMVCNWCYFRTQENTAPSPHKSCYFKKKGGRTVAEVAGIAATPFIRMDNQIIRRRAPGLQRPEDVGLFALLSAFLSIPGFRTPGGGLHRLVASHCSNGRHSINAAWQRLSQAGYLKRTRLPDASFRLYDLYALHGRPEPDAPAVSYASLLHGRRLVEQHRAFVPPTEHYTVLSYPMLMDARLSLAAKGIYALIRQRLQLAERVEGITILKESLRRSSGMGDCAFRRVWRELRDTGYLTLQHVWDDARRCMLYRYQLAEQAPTAMPEEGDTPSISRAHNEPQREQREHSASFSRRKMTVSTYNSEQASICKEPVEAEPPVRRDGDVEEAVKEQIEYDVLRSRAIPPALLELTVELMTGIALLPPGKTLTIKGAAYSAASVQRTLAALDANEVEFAINAAAQAAAKQPIRSMRGYLLACLFSAKVDFAMSVTLF